MGLFVAVLATGMLVMYGVSKKENAPNEELIEYLEAQRLHIDSMANWQQLAMDSFMNAAADREKRDSALFITNQIRLMQSIQTIKSQYEKIPSYTNLSKDSLRRIHADKFGK